MINCLKLNLNFIIKLLYYSSGIFVLDFCFSIYVYVCVCVPMHVQFISLNNTVSQNGLELTHLCCRKI